MDRLFDAGEAPPPEPPTDGPLAVRLRPRTLDDVVGQRHLLGEGSALRTTLESGDPHSMVLFGPPGTGKTTLARLAAEHADAAFEELSAVNAGRAEVRHYPCDHFDVWPGKEWHEPAVRHQVAFLQRHLAPGG